MADVPLAHTSLKYLKTTDTIDNGFLGKVGKKTPTSLG
jgi:hypothetical protein